MSEVAYEGWMVRYGQRKIGRSYLHMRYFVLECRLLAYYKRKPLDNEMVYVLSVYNKKEKYHRITMAAFNIREAQIWKEKIELLIDQHLDSQVSNGNKYLSFEYKSGMDNGRTASSSDHESQFNAHEDEDDSNAMFQRKAIRNGPLDLVFDWTRELDLELSNQNAINQAFPRKHWSFLQCQNGLRIFDEHLEVDYLVWNFSLQFLLHMIDAISTLGRFLGQPLFANFLFHPRSCSRAMKAVGVVEANCEEIFELVMSMDVTRYEWDCSFQYGSLVEEVDGHTAIMYHRLQLDWFRTFVWPRDLCYVHYWHRNDDGSYSNCSISFYGAW